MRTCSPANQLRSAFPVERSTSLLEANMSKRNAETHGGSGVDNKFRLPRSVWPRRYNVTLTPALVAPFKFTGSEVIEVEVREPVEKIVLNAKELEIHEATV